MEYGEGECGGFAGSGLGTAEDVMAIEDEGDGGCLYGCSGGVVFIRDGAEDGGVKIEVGELHVACSEAT